MGFSGYRRPDGKVGTRNHVLVMSTVSCVNGVVNAIGRALPEIKTITHTEGCGRGIADIGLSSRTLAGLGKNPNVAAVLLVGLGCEFIKAPGLHGTIAAAGKPVEFINVQDAGGSQKAARAGIDIAKKFLDAASKIKREECGFEELFVGIECGGSDAMSGVTANPVVGATSDWLVAEGATVMLGETTEMTGTADILARRAASPELAEKIKLLIMNQEKLMENLLGPLKSLAISPGNMDGGLSTIREKSMGCIIKGGTSRISEVIEYAAAPTKKGLIIMDTPGSDIFQLTGMAAGGANIVIFTTGRGTPAGFPIVPVIKVATNTALFEKMNDDMDLNAGRVLEGKSLDEVSAELNDLLKRVADGEKTKAEINLSDCIAIQTVGPAF